MVEPYEFHFSFNQQTGDPFHDERKPKQNAEGNKFFQPFQPK